MLFMNDKMLMLRPLCLALNVKTFYLGEKQHICCVLLSCLHGLEHNKFQSYLKSCKSEAIGFSLEAEAVL